jgi:hypothetical protein
LTFYTRSRYSPPHFRNSTFEVSSWLSHIEGRPERFKHGWIQAGDLCLDGNPDLLKQIRETSQGINPSASSSCCYSSSHLPRLRLVPFVAILLVLDEVIPLIVLYAPGMLPSTCILASQRERIDAKRREKQRTYVKKCMMPFWVCVRQVQQPERHRCQAEPSLGSVGKSI